MAVGDLEPTGLTRARFRVPKKESIPSHGLSDRVRLNTMDLEILAFDTQEPVLLYSLARICFTVFSWAGSHGIEISRGMISSARAQDTYPRMSFSTRKG